MNEITGVIKIQRKDYFTSLNLYQTVFKKRPDFYLYNFFFGGGGGTRGRYDSCCERTCMIVS